MPSGGIVFIVLADMETTLFGLGLSRWLHGYTRKLLDEVYRGRDVVVLHQAAIHDVVVVHRAPQHKVAFLGNLAGVAGRQEKVLAALALIGTGQAEVGDRALPEVIDEADTRPGRDLEDDRSLAKIDVHHAVDRGVVGGEPDALGVERSCRR